ncbi:MAG: methyltransferase domain-containing protein [Nitrospirae bacterium]|nr:methyltransferase domain-containing protein [Nitrospirota bacterium]
MAKSSVAASKTLRAADTLFRFSKRTIRRFCGSLVRILTIKAYLRTSRVRKLQIGAGANILDGWLNTNEAGFSGRVIFLDATKPFPLRDHTFDYIFSEHQIEHLTYEEGLFMLQECMRVLKPGGKIRIATPDLETLIGLHVPEKSELQKRYIRWIVDAYFPERGGYRESFVINNAFRNWGHRFLYDHATLQDALEKAGFVAVTRHSTGQSDDEVFRGIEYHGSAVGDEEMTRFETMVLEGKRPG